jgi:hypothetical protein
MGDWMEDHPGLTLLLLAAAFVIVNVLVGDPALTTL